MVFLFLKRYHQHFRFNIFYFEDQNYTNVCMCAFNENEHTVKRLDVGHTRRHFDTRSIDLHNDSIIIGYGTMFNIIIIYISTVYVHVYIICRCTHRQRDCKRSDFIGLKNNNKIKRSTTMPSDSSPGRTVLHYNIYYMHDKNRVYYDGCPPSAGRFWRHRVRLSSSSLTADAFRTHHRYLKCNNNFTIIIIVRYYF